MVLLRRVHELSARGELALLDNDGLSARLGAEGNQDAPVLARGECPSRKPDRGIFHELSLFIDHGEAMTGRGDILQEVQAPLGDERPAAAPVPDQFDHVHASIFQLGKAQAATDTSFRGTVVFQLALDRGHQAVELDREVDFTVLGLVIVEGIDLKDLDQQGLHVLDVHVELDRIAGLEAFLVLVRKVEVDPLLECLVRLG